MSKFDTLMEINVNDKTEKKGKFTYLSWAFAWAELKKVAPNATVTVYHDETNNKPYFGLGNAGVLVKVGVTVDEIEHISYLPCMDFKNNAISEDKVNAMDINKAIQRAMVKAIGLHGLGLYIYAGEDLPESEQESKTETKPANKKTSFNKKDGAKSVEQKDSTGKEDKPKQTETKTSTRRTKGF